MEKINLPERMLSRSTFCIRLLLSLLKMFEIEKLRLLFDFDCCCEVGVSGLLDSNESLPFDCCLLLSMFRISTELRRKSFE